MREIEAYNDLVPTSNEWLRRYQVPTDRVIDRTSLELIKIFVDTIDPNMERLPGLGDEPLDEANKFLTVELESIGIKLGKNPAREKDRAEGILKFIMKNPYVTYTSQKDGKKVYHEMPLLKFSEITSDGKCKLIFNDALRYFFFPEKDYSLCSPTLLKDIKERNFCASLIYEEACSYENLFKLGKMPFFSWSIDDVRKKFSYDKMENFSEDGTEYVSVPIKNMRPDTIRDRIIKPAIAELEKLFNEGITNFWIVLDVRSKKKSGGGRPPKDYFRFTLSKSKKADSVSPSVGSQQEIPYAEFEEINNLSSIKSELTGYITSSKLLSTVVKQIEAGKARGTTSDILQTIRNIKSHKNSIGKNRYEIGSKILVALGNDYGLGDLSKIKKEEDNVDEKNEWPDTLEGRIKKMMESPDIKDRASEEFSLSSEEVNHLLSGSFFETCFRNDKHKDPGEPWNKIVNHFFSWLNCMKIYGPLDKTKYGNSENKRNSQNGEPVYSKPDPAVEAALRYFDSPAAEENV